MLKRLVYAGCVLLTFGIKYAWDKHDRNKVLLSQYAPAFHSPSADRLINSDWSYTGPLGNLNLRFEPEGKLVVTSDVAKPAGRWEVRDNMLTVYIPGADQPHLGIFSKSTDELSGPSPPGMNPRLWSASRIHPSE